MKYMIGYLILCLVVGLWMPRRFRQWWVIPVFAGVLTLLFLISPHRM